MTAEEVSKVIETKKQYDIAMGNLEIFCSPIARALGYDGIEGDISINSEWVHFTMVWHGPYQAEDSQDGIFPTVFLTRKNGQSEATTYVMEEIEKRRRDYQKEKQERAEAEEKKKYLALKAKFEVE